MIRIKDSTSLAFRQFVDRNHAPVVMQVLPALGSGGVEQGVIDISAAVIRAGGRSIVVSSGGQRVHEISKAGGLHIELPVHSRNPLTIAANIGRLRKIIREQHVDIAHACSRAPAWSAQRAVLGTGARYVTSCHAAHKTGGAVKRLYNSSIAKGERVIAVSHFLADYLETSYGTDPGIIRVVHRGVAIEKFHPNSVTPDRLVNVSRQLRVPEGASIILVPARLAPVKGHIFLLDAVAEMKRRDVFCLFLGSDSGSENYLKELDRHISAKGLGGQVRIETKCDDMPAAYMISTVVVVPSTAPEGFSRVPVEAQAMGRPVIATDHGGARETIVRDETGLLVPPGDVGAMARALQEAMGLDIRGRALLATSAMSHVAQHFTNEQMCRGTLDVYAELLAAGSGLQALPSNSDRTEARVAR